MEKQRLARKEAANYLTERGLKISAATLAKYACQAIGPKFEYLGRWPIYPCCELDAWIESIRLTADTGSRRRRGFSSIQSLPSDLYAEQDISAWKNQ